MHDQSHPQPGDPEWEATIRAAAEAAADTAIQQSRQIAIDAAMQAARRVAKGAPQSPPSQGAGSRHAEADDEHSSQDAQQGSVEHRLQTPAQEDADIKRRSQLLHRFLKLDPPKFSGKLKPCYFKR